MRKYLFSLTILSLLNLAAAPATTQHVATPWELLKQAGALPATDSPRCSDMTYAEYPPYPKKWWDMASDSEQQNTEQFRLLRQSRLRMESNRHRAGAPQIRISGMGEDVQSYIKLLSPLRNLANIASDGAAFLQLSGHQEEAMRRLLDCWNLALCTSQTHELVSQLVGVGIEAMDCENIDSLAPGLRDSNATVRQLITQIISQLLDDEPARQNWRLTLISELRGWVKSISDKGLVAELVLDPSAAAIDKDLAMIDKACQFSSYSESESYIKQCVWPVGMTSIDRAILTEFRVLSDRRMSATDLAIQLFRADHGGNWPKTLDELAPTYLTTIPRDPFRSDNAAIGYKIIPHGWPDGKDRPVLYCDAGPDFHLNSEPRFGWYNEGKKEARQYRDLTLPSIPAK